MCRVLDVFKEEERKPVARAENDFYETPFNNTRALIRQIGPALTPGTTIFEPCVGDGAIPMLINRYHTGLRWRTNDINPDRRGRDESTVHTIGDARDAATWPVVDVIVANPPFSDALVMLRHALNHATKIVAFHLRISFWEPTGRPGRPSPDDRGPFWDQLAAEGRMPSQQIMLPRRKFDPNKRGSDTVTTMWLVWCQHDLPLRPFVVWSKGRDE